MNTYILLFLAYRALTSFNYRWTFSVCGIFAIFALWNNEI